MFNGAGLCLVTLDGTVVAYDVYVGIARPSLLICIGWAVSLYLARPGALFVQSRSQAS